jgi:hypothetical protein
MELVEKSGLCWYTSPVLGASSSGGPAPTHGFLGRAGGVSPPPFDSLNLNTRVGDVREKIASNMVRVKEAFGLSADSIVTVNQVHGDTTIVVKKTGEPEREADALITNTPGVPVGVLTADCLPILLYDPRAKAVGAVHAGRAGTLLGIASKTVGAMATAFGSDAADLRVALGPCIGPCCYEVGEEVFGEIKSALGPRTEEFMSFNPAPVFDIVKANTAELISAGLSPDNIEASGLCTSCDTERFFSYRRAEDAGTATGRQLSFIML